MLNLRSTDARMLIVTLSRTLYLFPLLLTGCISIPDAESTKVSGATNLVVDQTPVCITTPDDPSFQQHIYAGAGKLIAEKVRLAVEKSGRSAFVIDDPAKAQIAGCQFILDSQIVEYEDRATGWSGIPDRISLRLNLYPRTDPASQRSFTYVAKSSAMGSAFLEWGNANPTSLLQQQFANDVSTLISE